MPTPSEVDERVERDILALLLGGGQPGLWTVGELQLELGNMLLVSDALVRLERSGLVHRLEKFVLITRAARRCLGLADL